MVAGCSGGGLFHLEVEFFLSWAGRFSAPAFLVLGCSVFCLEEFLGCLLGSGLEVLFPAALLLGNLNLGWRVEQTGAAAWSRCLQHACCSAAWSAGWAACKTDNLLLEDGSPVSAWRLEFSVALWRRGCKQWSGRPLGGGGWVLLPACLGGLCLHLLMLGGWVGAACLEVGAEQVEVPSAGCLLPACWACIWVPCTWEALLGSLECCSAGGLLEGSACTSGGAYFCGLECCYGLHMVILPGT